MNLYEQALLLGKNAERADQDPDVGVDELFNILDILKATERGIRFAINARAPMHRILLPQLIIAIFAFIPTPAYKPSDNFQAICGPYLMGSTTELRPITLVCKLWRSLALGTSTLWSSLSCGNPKQSTMVVGSPYRPPVHISRIPVTCISAGPLYVHAEAPDSDYGHACTTSSFLSEHGAQVEELHIMLHANASEFSDALWGADEIPLPPSLSFESPTSLRRLAIHGVGRHEGFWQDRTLFGGARLDLSSLAMWGVPFLPLNPMGPSLTRLLLVNHTLRYDGGHEGAIPIRNLLRFLSSTPSLEQAYLEGIAVCGDDPGTLPMVPMPHARKLLITSGRGAAQLVSHLKLPETCLLRLEGDVRFPEQNEDLSSAIARLGWNSRKAHVLWEGGWNGSAGFVSLQLINGSAGGLRVDLSSRTTGTDAEVAQAIRAFLSVSPFVTTEELWLSGTKTADLLSETGGVISPLSALTTLHILNLKSLDRQNAGILWPKWPRIGSLEIKDTLPNLTSLHYCLPSKERIFDLVSLLRARASANHPVTRLFLSCKPYSPSDGSLNANHGDPEVIRIIAQASVSEVEVGEDLYNRFAWWSVVPSECTAKEEVHGLWPIWAEGVTKWAGAAHPGTLSIHSDVAFGTSTSTSSVGAGGAVFGGSLFDRPL